MSDFADLKLNKNLLKALEDIDFKQATPIQQKAIPRVLSGQDVVGVAQTGTGKTAAFVLPILQRLRYAQHQHPRALVLAPTRELVIQIAEAAQSFAKYVDLRCLAIYGGIGPKQQIEALAEGVDLLVATPGRLLDIYFREAVHLRKIEVMVLDEADKMMDMGFAPKIDQILEIIPQKKQKLLFSATMPPKVVKLCEDFLDFPEVVEVTPQATPAETVEQHLYKVPNFRTKINLLLYLLEHHESFHRVMVFVRTRRIAENVSKFLQRKLPEGQVRSLHANKGQNTRINAMEAFKAGEVRVLVTTDVSARGIDASLVSHVINFDIPLIYEDYVHRIGRTGRAQHKGVAYSFVNMAEEYAISKIEKIIRQEIPQKNLPEDLEITETSFEERQEMLREIDKQKRKENPDFKGAFHEKKKLKPSTKKQDNHKKTTAKAKSKRRKR